MRHWLLLLTLLVTALVYANSFPGIFLYDDRAIMLEHGQVRGDFRYASFLDHYGGRPLTLWTFHWNFRLAGEDPFSYHLISVLLHMLAVAGAYFVALEVGASMMTACGASLLFALHPLQTQAVNYIWSRSMLLMSVFGLAALWMARRRPVFALLLFQLAVWSRSGALLLALPLALLQPRLRSSALLLAVVNAAAFLTGLAIHAPLQVGWNYADPWAYWMMQPAAFWRYLRLMVWPSGLHLDHAFQADMLATVAGLAAMGGLLGLALAFRKDQTPLAWGSLWLVLLLLPSMLLPNTDLFNESRSYLALFGFALAGVHALVLLSGRVKGGWLAPALLTVVLIAPVPLTRQRNEIWTDELSIWRDAASKSPDKGRVRYNLGAALARFGEVEEAEREFQRSVALDPEDDMAHAGLGYCAEVRGDLHEAERHYRKALEIDPLNAYAREGLMRLE